MENGLLIDCPKEQIGLFACTVRKSGASLVDVQVHVFSAR